MKDAVLPHNIRATSSQGIELHLEILYNFGYRKQATCSRLDGAPPPPPSNILAHVSDRALVILPALDGVVEPCNHNCCNELPCVSICSENVSNELRNTHDENVPVEGCCVQINRRLREEVHDKAESQEADADDVQRKAPDSKTPAAR